MISISNYANYQNREDYTTEQFPGRIGEGPCPNLGLRLTVPTRHNVFGGVGGGGGGEDIRECVTRGVRRSLNFSLLYSLSILCVSALR